MSLPNSSPVAGADVEASPVRANLENLDTRLEAVEGEITDLAVSAQTYPNGVFTGGLTASTSGLTQVYTVGGLICNHIYYYKTTLIVDFTGQPADTYYVECDLNGDVALYTSTSVARTNLNTVVWNGAGFDSVTTADRTELFGTEDLVALNGRAGGQIIYGDTAASGNLVLEPTYHATKGSIVIGTGVAGVDYALNFNGETNDGILTWMEDEDYFKLSDDLLMNSTEFIYFRDTAISISSVDDGHMDIAADVSIDLNTPITYTQNVQPIANDTYYLGKNDDDTPLAYKGVILKDTTNGKIYRIEVISGVVTATDLTD